MREVSPNFDRGNRALGPRGPVFSKQLQKLFETSFVYHDADSYVNSLKFFLTPTPTHLAEPTDLLHV